MIKIMVDSASDISQEEAKKLGITMIPMEISFEEEEYLDGVDITKTQFFEKLIESANLPKTSQINPQQFDDVFREATQNGDEVIVITVSSKLSGTYSNAKKVADEYKGKVHVIDSLNACIGERLLCEYARRMVAEGLDCQTICQNLENKKKDINVIAVLNTLKYLKKGGRISPLVAFAGELMSIKPVVAVINGEVKLVGKAVGSKKGNNLLTKLVDEKGIDFDMPFGAIWSGLSDAIIQKYIEDSASLWRDNTAQIPTHQIGATIGTHVGPDAIGVAFFTKTK